MYEIEDDGNGGIWSVEWQHSGFCDMGNVFRDVIWEMLNGYFVVINHQF
jgi:hypothetical protein